MATTRFPSRRQPLECAGFRYVRDLKRSPGGLSTSEGALAAAGAALVNPAKKIDRDGQEQAHAGKNGPGQALPLTHLKNY